MERLPRGRYSKEFREEAVKLVIQGGLSISEASGRLSIAKSTLSHWVKAFQSGRLGEVGKGQRLLSEVELEMARLKRELAQVKMERDILKKAAAYFAKESQYGTR